MLTFPQACRLIFLLSQTIKTFGEHMTWLCSQDTNLAAESKPLHLAVFGESSHQTANMIFALGIPIPRWDFHFLFWEGRGANTRHISFAPLSSRCARSSSVEALSPRASKAGGFERLKYSTGNYRKVRSHVKLVFTSACSAQCAQTAFKIRHGCLGFVAIRLIK